jgi:hypothetical protein
MSVERLAADAERNAERVFRLDDLPVVAAWATPDEMDDRSA